MQLKKITFILLFLLLNACSDKFNTVIEVDIPELDNRLVVNALFNDSTRFNMYVYESQAVLNAQNNGFQTKNDATVRLFANEEWLEDLQIESLPFFNPFTEQLETIDVYVSENRPQVGVTYQVEVAAPNFETISSTATLPMSMPPLAVSSDTVWRNSETIDHINMKFDFEDIPNINNDYYIVVYLERQTNKTAILSLLDSLQAIYPDTLLDFNERVANTDEFIFKNKRFYSNAPILNKTERPFSILTTDEEDLENEEERGIAYKGFTFFDDELFANTHQEIELSVYGSNKIAKTFPMYVQQRIVLQYGTASKAFRNYHESSNLQYQNEANIIAEPVRVYTNINNGFGIFAGYTSLFFEL
ncbi:MAG: DUF4249 domain-containing protein [Chitinophagales bacterium]